MSIEPASSGEVEHYRSRALEVSFQLHAVTYVVVNLMLIGIWAAAGAGYFWPVWPLITWAPLVAIHGWLTYGRLHN
jgi:2TM domain-containing protein